MANQEHLKILLKQGAWERWTGRNPYYPSADLSGAILSGAHLDNYNLAEVDLSRADLTRTTLTRAFLVGTNLSNADLSGALLNWADLSGANLSNADLSGARLGNVDLGHVNLSGAILSGATLTWCDLRGANLRETDFTQTGIGWTNVTDVDLSEVKGLEAVKHEGPLSIGIDTIIRSQGKIPESFLRSAGVPPSIIEAIPSLIGSLKPIDFYSCFISYSSKDQDFAERLYADLQSKGVRCWYAPYDLKTGDKWRDRIEESIRLYDKLLLVLSHSSIESPRVEEEVVGAQEKEERYFRETGVERLVFFPIRLDEAVMKTSKAWAANLRRLRHIGDFHNWKQHDAYQKAFTRLLRDLKAEAQKMGSRDAITNDG